MPDYTKLIDAETWAFIERTNSYYPPDTSTIRWPSSARSMIGCAASSMPAIPKA